MPKATASATQGGRTTPEMNASVDVETARFSYADRNRLRRSFARGSPPTSSTAALSRTQECSLSRPYGSQSLSRRSRVRFAASNRSRLSISFSSARHSASNAVLFSSERVGPRGL
jgi:hypothetical protein